MMFRIRGANGFELLNDRACQLLRLLAPLELAQEGLQSLGGLGLQDAVCQHAVCRGSQRFRLLDGPPVRLFGIIIATQCGIHVSHVGKYPHEQGAVGCRLRGVLHQLLTGAERLAIECQCLGRTPGSFQIGGVVGQAPGQILLILGDLRVCGDGPRPLPCCGC